MTQFVAEQFIELDRAKRYNKSAIRNRLLGLGAMRIGGLATALGYYTNSRLSRYFMLRIKYIEFFISKCFSSLF